jgi:hypothetical protein
VDPIEAAMGAEINSKLLEAPGCQEAAVWSVGGMVLKEGENIANSASVIGIFRVIRPIPLNYFVYTLEGV